MNRGRGGNVHSRGRSSPMRWSPRSRSPVVGGGLSSSYSWRVKDGRKITQQPAGASLPDKLSSSHEGESGYSNKPRCDLEQDVPDAAGSCSAERNHSVAVEPVSAKDISSSSACSGSRDFDGKMVNEETGNIGTLQSDLSGKLNISEPHGTTELSLKPGVADGLAINKSESTNSHETEPMEQQTLVDRFDIGLTKQYGTVVLKPSLLAQNRVRWNEIRCQSERNHSVAVEPVSAKDISSSSACSGSLDFDGKMVNEETGNIGTLQSDLSGKLNISEPHGTTELSLKPGVADGLAINKSESTNSHETEPMEQQTLVDRFDICLTKQHGTVVLKPSLLAQNRVRRNERRCQSEAKNGTVLRSGMVLLKGYIPLSDQVKIVKKCRDLGLGPGGFYQPGYREGTKLHLKMMCLGKNWDPQTSQYGDCRPFDGAKPPNIPVEFHQLVGKAIRDSHVLIEQDSKFKNPEQILPWMTSNICLVNFYSQNGRLGLHQDKDETEESLRKGLPVVSFSIGDSADFLYGDERDVDKAEKVELKSGDVLIFGGKSRHVFHGVTAICPNSAPKLLLEEANLRPGRLNLTFRQH